MRILPFIKVRSLVACAMVALLAFTTSCDDEDEAPPPSITSFSPAEAEVGETVTITGANLADVIEVKFNGTTALIASKSATSVVATVPVGATSGKITVKSTAGEATSTADFTVVIPPPVPAITSFSPESGEAGIEVTITGTNLSEVTSVEFNGVAAEIVSKTTTSVVTVVPEGATSGKISVTSEGGEASSTADFAVVQKLMISDFEEEDADAIWGKAEDAGDITVSAIVSEDDNTFLHLQAKDNNGNHWVGGRYFEIGPDAPFGIEESDLGQVWMNVSVKNNASNMSVGKLVYTVVEEGAPDNRRNYERDFDVDWDEWKTISIRVDKFGYWNGTGMTDAVTGGADMPTTWSAALFVKGGNTTDTYDLSFDNLSFSFGQPLGEDIEGHH
jgi:hypothetical protein